MGFDVAILGAGVIGASAAFHLADRGYRVALVGDGASGATAAAGGMLSPHFEIGHEAAEPALKRMLEDSLDAWDAFAGRLSDDPYAAFGYRRDGVYGIGYHARPRGAVLPESDALPAFTRRPSLFCPDEGAVEPAPLLAALRREAGARGAALISGAGRVTAKGLEVAGERIAADVIVIATGANQQTGPSGLQGVKGEAFLFRLAKGDEDAVPQVVRSSTAYFIPRTDGTLYLGATEEWPGAISATADDLYRDAVRLLPCLERAERIDRFVGMRPFVSRRGPLIARDTERAEVIHAVGHHRNGILLAPLTAQAIEDLLVA